MTPSFIPVQDGNYFLKTIINDIMLHRIKSGITENVYRNMVPGTYYRIDSSRTGSHWELSRQLIGLQFILKY